ncbi:MAG: cobyric acid synthase [Acidobacteriota bacterium]|nr:cobyric acid synthase [Acidobacteriota bacterium]
MNGLAKCLHVLGTASDVGKSITATALCRIFADLDLCVAPFKAQNMSNNATVVPGMGEMARAQTVQAEAAGCVPHTDMNPVLLKPNTEKTAQVVLHGRVLGDRAAADYFGDNTLFRREALAALQRLRQRVDMVVMEGAGSCAEVNLRTRDFVNFDMAHAADCPALLVADIDRGGVFAQVIGTLEVLPELDRRRVAGIIVNRFRGDPSLFDDGMDYLRGRTGLPVLGLVPWYRHIDIEPEDALPPKVKVDAGIPLEDRHIHIAVIRLPHISNFNDFSPLMREPEVVVHYLAKPRDLSAYHLVLLPGSKNVRFDLEWLKRSGWAERILARAGSGAETAGICGGFQLLGRTITDIFGLEGPPGTSEALGLLPMDTVLERDKVVRLTRGRFLNLDAEVRGYEIHLGRTTNSDLPPLIQVTERDHETVDAVDGAISENGRIWGTYCHGLFESADLRRAFLRKYRPDFEPAHPEDDPDFRRKQYGLLADHFRKHLDIPELLRIAGI